MTYRTCIMASDVTDEEIAKRICAQEQFPRDSAGRMMGIPPSIDGIIFGDPPDDAGTYAKRLLARKEKQA